MSKRKWPPDPVRTGPVTCDSRTWPNLCWACKTLTAPITIPSSLQMRRQQRWIHLPSLPQPLDTVPLVFEIWKERPFDHLNDGDALCQEIKRAVWPWIVLDKTLVRRIFVWIQVDFADVVGVGVGRFGEQVSKPEDARVLISVLVDIPKASYSQQTVQTILSRLPTEITNRALGVSFWFTEPWITYTPKETKARNTDAFNSRTKHPSFYRLKFINELMTNRAVVYSWTNFPYYEGDEIGRSLQEPVWEVLAAMPMCPYRGGQKRVYIPRRKEEIRGVDDVDAVGGVVEVVDGDGDLSRYEGLDLNGCGIEAIETLASGSGSGEGNSPRRIESFQQFEVEEPGEGGGERDLESRRRVKRVKRGSKESCVLQ